MQFCINAQHEYTSNTVLYSVLRLPKRGFTCSMLLGLLYWFESFSQVILIPLGDLRSYGVLTFHHDFKLIILLVTHVLITFVIVRVITVVVTSDARYYTHHWLPRVMINLRINHQSVTWFNNCPILLECMTDQTLRTKVQLKIWLGLHCCIMQWYLT